MCAEEVECKYTYGRRRVCVHDFSILRRTQVQNRLNLRTGKNNNKEIQLSFSNNKTLKVSSTVSNVNQLSEESK